MPLWSTLDLEWIQYPALVKKNNFLPLFISTEISEVHPADDMLLKLTSATTYQAFFSAYQHISADLPRIFTPPPLGAVQIWLKKIK